jgi:processive 1,2-diacylglycerol beta-glucosyltransferase/1,2-diacylglycerol 3-beta-galactosyltransferase
MMKRKILFLYLDTGGGHKGPARILAEELESQYGDELSVELLNGFSPKQHFARLFFEIGYRLACTYLPAAYSFFYDLTTLPPALHCTKALCSWRTAPFLERYIREHGITEVVTFHFVIAPAAVRAIRRVNPAISFLIVVTDPFTVHPSWFLAKDQHFIVYTDSLKEDIIRTYRIPAERITVLPFVLNKQFRMPFSEADIAGLKEKHGIAAHGRTLLVTGGGDGLKGMVELVRYFLEQKAQFGIVAVCGHDSRAQRRLEKLACRFPDAGLKVFGFVPFMDELIRISDCVVTKAGASMMMEILACRKPLIISTFIHGQEQGNVRFVTENGAGWFLRTPAAIYEKITKLFGDSAYEKRVRGTLEKLRLPLDGSSPSKVSALAAFIREFQGIQKP